MSSLCTSAQQNAVNVSQKPNSDSYNLTFTPTGVNIRWLSWGKATAEWRLQLDSPIFVQVGADGALDRGFTRRAATIDQANEILSVLPPLLVNPIINENGEEIPDKCHLAATDGPWVEVTWFSSDATLKTTAIAGYSDCPKMDRVFEAVAKAEALLNELPASDK